MVTPINPDNPLTNSSDGVARTAQPANPQRSESQETSSESHSNPVQESGPEIENARQYYRIENNPSVSTGHPISTPQQARQLLEQVLQQFSDAPGNSLQTQATASAHPVANLLQRPPL